jgi:hypothetical protein
MQYRQHWPNQLLQGPDKGPLYNKEEVYTSFLGSEFM